MLLAADQAAYEANGGAATDGGGSSNMGHEDDKPMSREVRGGARWDGGQMRVQRRGCPAAPARLRADQPQPCLQTRPSNNTAPPCPAPPLPSHSGPHQPRVQDDAAQDGDSNPGDAAAGGGERRQACLTRQAVERRAMWVPAWSPIDMG